MHRMSVTQKGQLVIPKELRDKYGIAPNSEVIVTEMHDHIAIFPARDPVRQGRGMLKLSSSVTEAIRKMRREETPHESELMRRFVPKTNKRGEKRP